MSRQLQGGTLGPSQLTNLFATLYPRLVVTRYVIIVWIHKRYKFLLIKVCGIFLWNIYLRIPHLPVVVNFELNWIL